jgi:hypothetical protein
MSATSMRTDFAAPSYFYLLMAKSCFCRAMSTPHPKASGTLRQIGREYLAQARAPRRSARRARYCPVPPASW